MPDIKIDYAAIGTVANQLTTGKTDLVDKVNQLKGYVDALVQDSFATAKASPAFQETYTQFTTGVTTMLGGLDAITAFLNQTVSTHEQHDQSLANAIKQ